MFNLREFFYEVFGYRKAGLLGILSPTRKEPVFGIVPRNRINNNDEIDLSGGIEVSQGAIPSCACTTLGAIAQDEAIETLRDKNIEILWKDAWDEMKNMKIADDKMGSHLVDNLWFFQKHGFFDNKGNLWKADIIEEISRKDIVKFTRMGYQVYTGTDISSPMCNSNFILRWLNRIVGGHAFRIIGLKKFYSVTMSLAETTWLNYGLKKESQFMIHPVDHVKLFSCYVMTIKKV